MNDFNIFEKKIAKLMEYYDYCRYLQGAIQGLELASVKVWNMYHSDDITESARNDIMTYIINLQEDFKIQVQKEYEKFDSEGESINDLIGLLEYMKEG